MKKSKRNCGKCKKRIIKFNYQCKNCNHYFHKTCESNLDQNNSLCTPCLNSFLPFFKLQNLEYMDNLNLNDRLENCPSFKIQSLLDEMKQNNDGNSFISESLKSSYYDTNEFNAAKFPKDAFSLIHLNTASLQLHIDDIKTLLSTIENEIDVLCFTESKLKQNANIITNIEIPGYTYFHTNTLTDFGGTIIYVKSHFSPKLLPEFSKSVEGNFESTFIEIKNKNKSLVIGTIYRHPKADDSFLNEFLHPTLHKLGKMKKKVMISGDFNFDLIKYDVHKPTNEFYDIFSSYSYRPCILQPSRVTYKSNTLIDNIFVNDLSCNSNGGNLTYSISDHYCQFSFCDIFMKIPPKNEIKFKRNYRNFKNEEFIEELCNINWNTTLDEAINVNDALNSFYYKIDSLLNIMAPIRKMTTNEQRLEQRPWITRGILKSMRVRDSLYKKLTNNKKNLLENKNISDKHKKYRNLIVTLLRKSKENYFRSYFERNKENVKKTWQGIKNILSISKKKVISIDFLNYKGKTCSKNLDKANALNDFYTNIGKTIENKIPNSNKNFSEFLSNTNQKNILHKPCNQKEVSDIIRSLQSSKSSGPNSIPTNLIHTASFIF